MLNFLKIAIPLSAVAVISRAFTEISFFYYLVIPLFILFFFAGYKYIFRDKHLKILLLLLILFGVWAAVTSFWSGYPLISLSRSAYFIFISAGAVLGGYLWQQFNSGALSFLIPANIIVIALSLFSLITNIPSDSLTGGNTKGFMGFAGHQNTLASVILFTIPALFMNLVNGKSQTAESKILREESIGQNSHYSLLTTHYSFYSILLTLNLLILALTYSRASWLSLAAGIVIFLILTKKWNILAYASAVSLLLLSLIWFSPSIKEKADSFIRKDFPNFYFTRELLWVPSYNAALSGGLTGLGYGISHPEIIVEGTGSYFENGRYIREKGNSFLALIEETGIIGLILFLLPIGYVVKSQKSNKSQISNPKSQISNPVSGIRNPSPYSILSTHYSLLLPLLLHSQFEAWMVGVGSVQLPLFFFYAGSIANYFRINNEN